jgi:hypothetical protein
LHLSKELFFLNSGTTWASFNFSGKMALFIYLFIKFVIGLTIAGFAKLNGRSLRTYFYERCVGGPKSTDFYPTIKPFLT